ncbi:response regulator [Thalassomonas actiniarum]|uniref:histidine kinase n=2 Tax=Thalassomonas actiniarum TaxID=485447 RepID=A0AAF0C2M0_9GAMM|nr:response regulator [Thalassomonas actiniarum]
MLVVFALLPCSLQASVQEVAGKVHHQEIALLEQSLLLQQSEVDKFKAQRNFWLAATLLAIAALLLLFYLQKKQRKCLIERANVNEMLLAKKTQLLADISHEFRTPLTLVLGPIQQILTTSKNSEIKQSLSLAQINANRLLRMVDQLLDLAKIEHLIKDKVAPVNFSKVVTYSIAAIDSACTEKSISLVSDIGSEMLVDIDRDSAEKITVNLLTNAIKYTQNGGRITVRCLKRGEQLQLEVQDNGMGIAKEQHSRIFERFVRISSSQTEQISGAGIGLALVKELVETNGGSISVSSEVGEGTRFTVFLPISKQHSDQDDAENSIVNEGYLLLEKAVLKGDIKVQDTNTANKMVMHQNSVDVKNEQANKQTILIVEDHPQMREYLKQILSPHYHCLLANDGDSGISQAIEVIPDLIISDIMMPNRSGYELARVLRGDASTLHIPIIALTSSNDDNSRLLAWRCDVDEYICKPFKPDELLFRVANLLNIRQLLSKSAKARPVSLANSEETLFAGGAEKDRNFIQELKCFIEQNFQETELNACMAYTQLAMSERQFHRKMKALLEQSFSDYVRAFRLRQGAQMLCSGVTVTQTAYDCGFTSQSYFSACFKAQYGMTPKHYQKQQR